MLSSQGSEENDTSSDESGSTVELEVEKSPPRFGMTLHNRTVPVTQKSSTKDSKEQKTATASADDLDTTLPIPPETPTQSRPTSKGTGGNVRIRRKRKCQRK